MGSFEVYSAASGQRLQSIYSIYILQCSTIQYHQVIAYLLAVCLVQAQRESKVLFRGCAAEINFISKHEERNIR
jgi:hypothetical protein